MISNDFGKVGGALLVVDGRFFIMALGVHGGSHHVYGKPRRPKARKKGGEVQVSNQPETSNTTSRVRCHFPETPQRHG